MDINKIFGSFTSEDDNIVAIDFTEHPTYLLGLFKKLIINHVNFKVKNIEFLSRLDPEMSPENIGTIGDIIIFNRAFFHLTKINPSNEAHIQVIEQNYSPQLMNALNMAISFFEPREEYEKCAHILKIKNIFLENTK
jgi:hypothetical protein